MPCPIFPSPVNCLSAPIFCPRLNSSPIPDGSDNKEFACNAEDPGMEPESPALQADSLPAELSGKPHKALDLTLKEGKQCQRWIWSICVSDSETDRPEFQTQICHTGLKLLLVNLKFQRLSPDGNQLTALGGDPEPLLMDGVPGPQLLCIWGLVLWLELDILSRPLSQTLVTWEDGLGLCSWFVLLSLPRSSWTHSE